MLSRLGALVHVTFLLLSSLSSLSSLTITLNTDITSHSIEFCGYIMSLSIMRSNYRNYAEIRKQVYICDIQSVRCKSP